MTHALGNIEARKQYEMAVANGTHKPTKGETTMTATTTTKTTKPSLKAVTANKTTKTVKAEEKPIVKATAKPEPIKVAPTKPAKKEKEKYTRGKSVFAAIRKLCLREEGASMKEIMKLANGIAIEHGMNSNPTATNINKYTIDSLLEFGILVKVGSNYKLA